MPWSNQTGNGKNGGGGPWGPSGGGRGPWGDGPKGNGGGNGGGGNEPPDLEDLIRKSQDQLKNVFSGGGGGGAAGGGSNKAFLAVAFLVGLALLGYSFFTFRVQPDELGVVLRFGEFSRQAQPGLNFRLPYPVEQVYLPKVTRVNRIDVGMSASGGRGSSDVPAESLMLTGDENIVDVDFTVLWRIKDASAFLFRVESPVDTVKSVAESAMREVVGSSEIQPILTQGRQITETAVQEQMQATLDRYNSGIEITQVQLLQVDPPAQVIDAFRDVQAARADNERLQNEAQAYSNRVIPEARGEAARILEAANGYKDQTVAEARGQADRFTSVYEEYRKAPDVTRQRLYLETMERVLNRSDKVIIDGQGSSSGVVPYLPLEGLGARSGGSSR